MLQTQSFFYNNHVLRNWEKGTEQGIYQTLSADGFQTTLNIDTSSCLILKMKMIGIRWGE